MAAAEYVFSLNSEARKYCEETLNETEESRTKALHHIEQWSVLNAHYHIKNDKLSLLQFLRGCKFDLDRTKRKLIDFYTMRRDIPEWYHNRIPSLPEIQELAKLGVFIPLRKNFNNQLIVIIRTAVHNPRIHSQNDVFKTGNMILDTALKDNEEAQIYGIVAIFDMTGVGIRHANALTPTIIKKAVRSWQNYYCRPKRLDFVNAPFYINVVLKIFKSFMSEKMRKRVEVHFDGFESLHKIVSKSVLPKEYGGEGESLADLGEYWRCKILENHEWFVEDEKHKAD